MIIVYPLYGKLAVIIPLISILVLLMGHLKAHNLRINYIEAVKEIFIMAIITTIFVYQNL